MTINPSTDRGSTGRWKYGWVPPTPEQFCEMIQDTAILPDNGPKSLVSLKAKAMSVLSLKSESELKAEEKK